MKKLLFLFFILQSHIAFSQQKVAQSFAINIGNFANPDIADFSTLHKFGMVYATPIGNEQSQIFVGDYAEKKLANIALSSVKKSYPNAYVTQKKVTTTSSSMIQLATKKVGEKINWTIYENAGHIYAACDGKFTRILSGNFASDSIAQNTLADLKALGYKDAIVKNMTDAQVHKISQFEAGTLLENPIRTRAITPVSPPVKPVDTVVIVPLSSIYVGNYATKELKRALSEIGTYKGTIDENTDKTIDKSFEAAQKTNKTLAKYTLLAKAFVPATVKVSELQTAINQLNTTPKKSIILLEKSTQPIAKAYIAYTLFIQNGNAANVNKLMNEAIQAAFKGIKKHPFPFDATANYDYKELPQLIKHLRYIQGVAKEEPAVPVWLFEEHPKAAHAAYSATEDFKIQANDPAMNIEAIKLLKLMSDDLVTTATKPVFQEAKNTQERSKMMVVPRAIAENQDDWNKKLWNGLNEWATKDDINAATIKAYKATYYMALTKLETHFKALSKTSSVADIRNQALFTLKSLVEAPLEKYGK